MKPVMDSLQQKACIKHRCLVKIKRIANTGKKYYGSSIILAGDLNFQEQCPDKQKISGPFFRSLSDKKIN